MLPSNNILFLTSDLLATGGFSHLKDNQVSALHFLMLQFKGPLTSVQQKLLLSFWYNADPANIPPALLYRCNTVLQQYGGCPIIMSYAEMECD